MTRAFLVVVLLLAVATARSAAAGPLWQDTVYGGGPDGQANAVVTDGVRACAGGFVATKTSVLGILRCYDARTGSLLWEDRPGADGDDYEVGRLATDGGRLFATALVVRPASGFDWVVRAHDIRTGELLWEDARDAVGTDEPSGLATAGGRVFVTGAAGGPDGKSSYVVRACDAATGALLWQDLSGPVGPADVGLEVPRDGGGFDPIFDVGLAADAGLAVVGRRHWDGTAALLARDATTGTPVWRDDDPRVTLSLQIGAGRVFGASGAVEFLARTFALDTGRPVWSATPDPEGSDLVRRAAASGRFRGA